MSRLSPALDGRDLPLPELQAMRLDGEVFALLDAWCPVDVTPDPAVRARAVLAGRSPRLVAGRTTAAWVWGALPVLPRPIELCVDVRARARLRPGADAIVHEIVLAAEDLVLLDGAAVTTPLRTLLDLARSAAADDDTLRALARTGRVTADGALAGLGRALPGARRARVAIARALDPERYPAFTR